MFGSKKQSATDRLPVSVHVIQGAAALAKAERVWNANARTVYRDASSNKELLHFNLVNPSTVIWLQRDVGRTDTYELIMSWAENTTTMADVFVLVKGDHQVGDDSFVQKVLDALLTTAATVPVAATTK